MIKKLFAKKATTENFLKELFQKTIDEKSLHSMVDAGIPINFQDEDGNSFLHLCLLNNKSQSAKWLIQNTQINLTLLNKQGLDSITVAIQKNSYNIVEMLIKTKKVDINKLDSQNRNMLQNAVLAGSKETAVKLIKNNIDINHKDNHNRNVLFDAIAYGDEDFINLILELDNLDANIVDTLGENLLHKSEILKSEDLCIKLLQKGVDPTFCSNEGNNFLYHCASRGMEGSKLLDIALEYGCNINATVKNNNSVLVESLKLFYRTSDNEVQRRESLLKMAENLVLKGIDINAVNNDGENGLFDAVRNNCYQTTAFFLTRGINPNIRNKKTQTPLLIAAMNGIEYLDIILLLLEYGANANIVDNKSRPILETLNLLAIEERGFSEGIDKELVEYVQPERQHDLVIKEILQNSKISLNHLTSKQEPLFFTPMLYRDISLFSLYLNNGFDINQTDNHNLAIFYVYVYTVFSQNKYFEDFKTIIATMKKYDAEINFQDTDGKHVFSKIITKETNIKLFKDLIEVCRFDYSLRDKLGRTVMHQAVLAKNFDVLKLLFEKEPESINISDAYGIRPLTYGALTQCYNIVEMLLNSGIVYINCDKIVPTALKVKFQSMIRKLDDIKNHTKDADMLRKLNILTDQIRKDFKVEK